MFSKRKEKANLKFDDWLSQGEQQATLSKCEGRYATSRADSETFMQFLRPEIRDAIDEFVDTKTRELSSANKQLTDELEKEKHIANEYSRKLYDTDKQAATARANHIELQREYSKLNKQLEDAKRPQTNVF